MTFLKKKIKQYEAYLGILASLFAPQFCATDPVHDNNKK